MILSNEEIRRALESRAIEITPGPQADQYTTSAVDLFLGNQLRVRETLQSGQRFVSLGVVGAEEAGRMGWDRKKR